MIKKTTLSVFTVITLLVIFLPDFSRAQEVEVAYLMKNVKFFSSKELWGRLAGSEGFYKAANYAKNEFEKFGLKPIFNGSYFQKFQTEFNDIIGPCELHIKRSNESYSFELGKDFICRGFTGSGEIEAEVVFCGYGFCEPDYDDYANVDVKGKIVMVFKQVPSWKLNENSWNGSLRYRANIAYQKGAIGTILVSKPLETQVQKPIGSVMDGEGIMLLNYPHIHIDTSVAREILTNCGYELSTLQKIIDSTKKPYSVNTGTIAKIFVKAKYDSCRETMNIGGIIEGNDLALKNSYIIIGAHLDHVGGQGGKIYFPGANDNASGSSAVLEIARLLSQVKDKLKRSVIFVLFSNEESGLQGSQYFVDYSPVPLKNIVAMLNLDCIGYGDSIKIGNGKSCPLLWETVRKIDKQTVQLMTEETWFGGGADAQAFHNAGIPSVYFVTTNSYQHLHLTTDTPETLNEKLFGAITKLAYETTFYLLSGEYQREQIIK
ncbi:MAG: M20/M25/M40 family metallo-hydrolase [Ignavibacteria bacterium]